MHGHGGAGLHEPAADAVAEYRRAFDAARPDAGRTVVSVQLEARVVDWPFASGLTLPAWGYNGQVPGPAIEAHVGDVLEINGEPPVWRSWEDVVNVPPRSTVRIAWLPDDRPGSWMYHCHILEHHAAGMMAHFDVQR